MGLVDSASLVNGMVYVGIRNESEDQPIAGGPRQQYGKATPMWHKDHGAATERPWSEAKQAQPTGFDMSSPVQGLGGQSLSKL